MMVRGSPVGEAELERLARGYGDLVYAAALRQVGGDTARAGDVAQAVMVVMVMKGRAGKLPEERFMAGWILRVTAYAVKQQGRAEARRKKHEQSVPVGLACVPDEAAAREIKGVLDEALLGLGRVDREVIVRRYLGGQEIAAVAGAVGMVENSAARRISRALEKLRKLLVKRGVTAPVAGIVAVMAAESAMRAPASAAVVGQSLPSPLAHMTLRALARAKAGAWIGAAAAGLCVIGGVGLVVLSGAPVVAAKDIPAAQATMSTPSTTAPAIPHLVSVAIDRVDAPASPELLQTLLAGLKEAQAKCRNINVRGSSAVWMQEPVGGELVQESTAEGEAWMDTARHFRADIVRDETRVYNNNSFGPPHLSSFIQTWDGTEQRILFRAPLSRPQANTNDQRHQEAVGVSGTEFSMQLCWSEESRADASGSHNVIDRYPLAPEVLALMKLSVRRVTLTGGGAAMELQVEIPNDGIAAPKDTITRGEKFWFDPARGYGVLGRQETQSIDGRVVMERTWQVDRLADAGGGNFYPAHGVMAWAMRGGLFLFEEYTANWVISNETAAVDLYHVAFPKGVPVTDFKKGMGTLRGK